MSVFMKNLLVSCLLVIFGYGILLSCQQYDRNKSHSDISNNSIRQGEKLAKQYCQSCHLLPEPAQLDAKTWEEGVLPVMGPMLGVFKHLYHKYPSGRRDRNLDSNYYPKNPLVTPEQWQNIIDYYTATSPDSLQLPTHTVSQSTSLPGFQVMTSKFKTETTTSSFIKIDSEGRKLWLADLFGKKLYSFDDKLNSIDSVNTNSAVVDIEFNKSQLLLCNIGEINPNNQRLGSARYLDFVAGRWTSKSDSPLLKNLARPVQVVSVDFDLDKELDYLVCEFGFLQGNLNIYYKDSAGEYKASILKPGPGAEKCYVKDFNHDGLPDVMVLFAQGDESIRLFTNLGGRKFEEKRILRFPSVYGSTYFELHDFNNDGHEDILYACGDNADYSQVLKPYHGIYIFLNDGRNQFSQKYFYHMHGCFKAIARDFDRDGDLDIAAISFFADFSRDPDQSFVLLRNEKGMEYKDFSFTGSNNGRWITMDAGDLDGDGWVDLVLGNFSYGPVMMSSKINWKETPSFLFLKNTGH